MKTLMICFAALIVVVMAQNDRVKVADPNNQQSNGYNILPNADSFFYRPGASSNLRPTSPVKPDFRPAYVDPSYSLRKPAPADYNYPNRQPGTHPGARTGK